MFIRYDGTREAIQSPEGTVSTVFILSKLVEFVKITTVYLIFTHLTILPTIKDIGLQFYLLNFVKKCILYAKIMISQKKF